MIYELMKNSEIVNYFFKNMSKFYVSEQEKSKIMREKKFHTKNQANGYVLHIFKNAISNLKNGQEGTYIFSISEHTVALVHNQMYFHVQIFKNNKADFQIKTMRGTSDFNIHNYKNHGLRVTNHLIDRYMQYFKKFIPFSRKNMHQDQFEQELMITLKNQKTHFAKELTDTVYLIVDTMYFVLKKQGKNTISLVTMRPYEKTLELTRKLKRVIPNPESYKNVVECTLCTNYISNPENQIDIGKESMHKTCLESEYSTNINYNDLKEYGNTYLRLIKEVKNSKKSNFKELVDALLEDINKEKETDNMCVSCYKNIILENKEYYERNHNNQKIHQKCAHNILDIKNTEKIFVHSGLKGLYSTAMTQKEQALQSEVERLKQQLNELQEEAEQDHKIKVADSVVSA